MRYLLSLIGCLSLSGQDASRLCSVTFRVVDYAGRPKPYRVASFVDPGGQEFKQNFEALRGRAPCAASSYRFRVARTDLDHPAGDIRGSLTLFHSENWITLVTNPNLRIGRLGAGEVSMALPSGYFWKGRVTPTSGERLWIHLRSAVGSIHVEAEADASGEFRIYAGFAEGLYLLYVMGEKGDVVHTSTLNITAYGPIEPLVIKLSTMRSPAIIVK